VTGHRTLKDPERMQKSVIQVLQTLDGYLKKLPHWYCVVSPLGEGADRLVSRSVLDWTPDESLSDGLAPRLDVVLPMPLDSYIETFAVEGREASTFEFQILLRRAQSTLSVRHCLCRRSSRPSGFVWLPVDKSPSLSPGSAGAKRC
jgi:hypothetical protein